LSFFLLSAQLWRLTRARKFSVKRSNKTVGAQWLTILFFWVENVFLEKQIKITHSTAQQSIAKKTPKAFDFNRTCRYHAMAEQIFLFSTICHLILFAILYFLVKNWIKFLFNLNLLYKDESVRVCVYVRRPAVGPTQPITLKFGMGSSFQRGSAPS
jgi:hypothetical protein